MTSFDERLNGLRWRARAARRLFRPGAQPTETFLAPVIPPPDKTEGQLDHPGAGAMFEEDIFGFGGWVAFENGSPVGRVEAWLDEEPIGNARVSVPRPDVAGLKDLPLAHLSGFEQTLPIDILPPAVRSGARELRVVATSAAGERVSFEPVPIFLRARDAITDPPPAPPAPLVPPPRTTALRVLVFTHQLTLGGAQLYLLDLLREMQARHDVELTVVSGLDGPLRPDLEAVGIDIHLTSLSPFEKIGNHLGRVAEIASWIGGGDFDVAFMNTATSGASFGAEIAWHLGIPAVWAIHESFPPQNLWGDLRKPVREVTEGTLAQARFGIFEADATREIYRPLLDDEHCLTIPYGVDAAPIEAARAELDRDAARRKLGVPLDARLVICIGTVEPRKSQVQLAQAFSMIAGDNERAHLVFIGARKNDPHSEDLVDVIEESPYADRMKVLRITPDVQVWYGIADLLVCASDVESLPRTVLEAMLWETPILATDVFGIPDVIEDGVTGWLCASRDLPALASGLERALGTPEEERRRIAGAARSLVEDRHDLPRYADRVMETLRRAVADPVASAASSDSD